MLILATLILLVPATSVFGGKIFGDIRIADKPIGEGVKVTIGYLQANKDTTKAPNLVLVDSTVTDKFGSYRLTVKEERKCLITVHYDKQNPAFEVLSYKDAQRYDLKLEKVEGKYTLKRR